MERRKVQIDGVEIEVIRPDRIWLQENYELFLSEFFAGGRMPDYIDLLTSTRLRGTWGWAGWRGTYKWRYAFDRDDGVNGLESEEMGWHPGLNGSYVHRNSKGKILLAPERAKYHIKLKNVDWLPEYIYEDTLIHEMCHIFCYYNKLWAGEGHDGYFLRLAEYIKRKSNGKYNITRYVKKEFGSMADKVAKALGTDENSEHPKDGEQSFVIAVTLDDVIYDESTDDGTNTIWINAGDNFDAAKVMAERISSDRMRSIFNANDFAFYVDDADVEEVLIYVTDKEWMRKHTPVPRNVRCSMTNKKNWRWISRSIDWLISNGWIECVWDSNADDAPGQTPDLEPAPAPEPKSILEPKSEPEPVFAPAPEPDQKPETAGTEWNPSDGSPMDYIRSLPPDRRMPTFKAFTAWFGNLDDDKRERLGDLRMRSPEMDERDWWLGWFLRNEFHRDVEESLDYTDEQKLAMLTEGIIGRTYERAKRWLEGLASKVKSSLFGKQQVRFTGEVDEDGNEIAEVGIS